MREAHMGNANYVATAFQKGNIPWNKGKKCPQISKIKMGNTNVLGKHWKLSEEAKRNISESKRGEKHPNWKNGISPVNIRIRHSIEYRLWREAVFARDNFTCQKCGIKGAYLHPHHISNFAQFPELRFAIDNGITLCKKCHKEFHRKYGRKNNTRKQVIEFIKKSLMN